MRPFRDCPGQVGNAFISRRVTLEYNFFKGKPFECRLALFKAPGRRSPAFRCPAPIAPPHPLRSCAARRGSLRPAFAFAHLHKEHAKTPADITKSHIFNIIMVAITAMQVVIMQTVSPRFLGLRLHAISSAYCAQGSARRPGPAPPSVHSAHVQHLGPHALTGITYAHCHVNRLLPCIAARWQALYSLPCFHASQPIGEYVFKVHPLDGIEWAVCIAIGAGPIPWSLFVRWVARLFRPIDEKNSWCVCMCVRVCVGVGACVYGRVWHAGENEAGTC
jgi:hypothetical protein